MKFTNQYQRYESEFTRFINELKQKNPQLEEGQRSGRALLWDKPSIDLDTQERTKESRVKQSTYLHQNKS